MATEYKRTYAAWAEAFTIFEKYEPGKYAEIASEHDVIYAGADPASMSAEDRARLDELGWSESDEYGCWEHFT